MGIEAKFRSLRLVLPQAVLAALAALGAWLSEPELPKASAVAPNMEAWLLLPYRTPDLADASAFLASSPIWGKVEVAKREVEAENPEWRMLGVLRHGDERTVLIRIEKQPDRQLHVGDKLPGGAAISDIGDSEICVVINGKKRALPIYPRERQVL